MPLIGPVFFILGLVVVSVAQNSTMKEMNKTLGEVNATATPSTTINITTTSNTTYTASTTSISNATSTMNITNTSSTVVPSTTTKKGDETSKDGGPRTMKTTPKPPNPSKTTTAKAKSTEKPSTAGNDNTGIIILVVIILVAFGFGIACFLARKRGRRYSVDFNSRPDEANIPLSTMEPELHIDTVSQNGMQSFAEIPAKQPQEPEVKPEAQEEKKAEPDKSVVDASAEPAAPAPTPDGSEDKPKEDVVEPSPPATVEPSPPAPVDPSAEEKTDDEGAVSNKTSVESLKEANENNSNNADVSLRKDLKSSDLFWDVPLNSPV